MMAAGMDGGAKNANSETGRKARRQALAGEQEPAAES